MIGVIITISIIAGGFFGLLSGVAKIREGPTKPLNTRIRAVDEELDEVEPMSPAELKAMGKWFSGG
jgi:hypothetical protein